MRVPAPVHLALLSTAALLAAVGLNALTASAAAADEVYPRPTSGSWAIDGHGWGHGRGMSQYGAQGAASLGQDADQITSFYYPHTTRASLADTAVRVLLQGAGQDSTEVYPASGLLATDQASGVQAVLPSGYSRWRAVVDGAGLHLQSARAGSGAWTTQPMGGRSAFAGPLRFSGAAFIRLAAADGSSRDYRGAVQAVATSASTLASVAVVPMEQYLLGVVPREAISSWLPAALQAQAIAARSYSDYKRAHAPAGASWDICDSTMCQVFGGSQFYGADGSQSDLETPSTTDAVRATAGVVRVDAAGASIFAEFSASNGGWSTAGSKPYLVAQRDDFDAAGGNPVHAWSATLQAADIERSFPSLGILQQIRVTGRDGNGDWGGRVQTVVLEGVDAAGNATSVTTTGASVYNVHPWPGSPDGLRSDWWQVHPAAGSTQVSRTSDLILVKAPGAARSTMSVLVQNTGTTSWPVARLHLVLAGGQGAPDPLVGGSTEPGVYVRDRTHPGAAQVAPGDRVDFTLAADAAGVPVGVRTAAYQVQVGNDAPLGDTFSWTVTVVPADFAGAIAAGPVLVSSTAGTGPAGAPPALFADGHTVVVPRSGATVLKLSASPAGNLAWPVADDGALRLGTTGPQNRSSSFAGAGWLGGGRPATLAGTSPVPVRGTGTFRLQLNGNGGALGVTRESFAPLWEGQSWVSGAQTDLVVVRVDPTVSRAATTELAPMANVGLTNAPTGTGVIFVRLRNVGGAPWTVGQEALQTTAPAVMATAAWSSPTRPPALAANITRPGQGAVYPGEVGEWRIPLSGFGKAAGTTAMVLRATGPGGGYGPSFPVSTTVLAASVAGQVTGTGPTVQVPGAGSASTWFDVRNIGNSAWPVGGAVRSLMAVAGGSPSRASSWTTASRPASLTTNLSTPGSALVQPGEIARFSVLLAGNGRSPRHASETFGLIWDGVTGTTVSATLSYIVT